MDTGWIQVFVLTLSECIAPAGKTVCQEREFEMQFVERAACELAMEQMIWLADGASDVIINREKTRCTASAAQRPVFSSAEDVQANNVAVADWRPPEQGSKVDDFIQKSHKERLASLQTCEEANGVAPCKVGEIIIEEAAEQRADVWRLNP